MDNTIWLVLILGRSDARSDWLILKHSLAMPMDRLRACKNKAKSHVPRKFGLYGKILNPRLVVSGIHKFRNRISQKSKFFKKTSRRTVGDLIERL